MTTQHAAPVRQYPTLDDRQRELEVQVTDDGQFSPDDHDYAREQVRAAAARHNAPVLRASVQLVRYTDPALPRPVVARATVNVNGRFVRTQTTAASARQGLDALHAELRKAIERLDSPRAAAGRSTNADLTPPEPDCTVDEAIVALDALDRPFQLFRDVDTGEDTVVYRAGPTGYRLAQTRHRPLGRRPRVPLSISIEPAPRLEVETAAARLDRDGLPFLFFADPTTGRGAVTYVHKDGHVGLVTL
jgi:hypothetical protein